MREGIKHLPVNWMDGMKINKSHFIAQDNASANALSDGLSSLLSPFSFGLLPATPGEVSNLDLKVSADNQQEIRVMLTHCQAITSGGVRVHILPATKGSEGADEYPVANFSLKDAGNDVQWWIAISVNPYLRAPAGTPDVQESPPRFPFNSPSFSLSLVPNEQLSQVINNPYSLLLGTLSLKAGVVSLNDDYIPPCAVIAAHADLVGLMQDIDTFLGNLESRCSLIIQKIYKKNQQNELSELVQFLCDRMVLHLAPVIVQFRWRMLYESPGRLIEAISSLARVMKNTIDLRIGSGKEEMLNYMSEWCELNQGELETLLMSVASMRYNHNDVNALIPQVVKFLKVTDRLFDTLNKLDYIGKRKESGIFVKEEKEAEVQENKARRRFFG